MSRSTIKHAIEAVEDKGIDTDLELYEEIEHQPGESIYGLAKSMHWSTGKTYSAARRLEKAGMIHIVKAVKNGRDVLVVKSKTWEEYFTAEELEEMRRPEFMDEVERFTREAWQDEGQ
jgi:predicted transcriptional regulator